MICIVIYFQRDSDFSVRIQAIALLLLILVTAFYARKTQKLVEQERMKRNAEFGERRLKELFYPILGDLNEMAQILGGIPSLQINVKIFSQIRKLKSELYLKSYFKVYLLTIFQGSSGI